MHYLREEAQGQVLVIATFRRSECSSSCVNRPDTLDVLWSTPFARKAYKAPRDGRIAELGWEYGRSTAQSESLFVRTPSPSRRFWSNMVRPPWFPCCVRAGVISLACVRPPSSYGTTDASSDGHGDSHLWDLEQAKNQQQRARMHWRDLRVMDTGGTHGRNSESHSQAFPQGLLRTKFRGERSLMAGNEAARVSSGFPNALSQLIIYATVEAREKKSNATL
ncbi:hypothetical protein BC827DRAFT_1159627 [Russula dissimulans]|nr:hypothetical protein BC827DRAFT_1159627 [Russula dissimulans]